MRTGLFLTRLKTKIKQTAFERKVSARLRSSNRQFNELNLKLTSHRSVASGERETHSTLIPYNLPFLPISKGLIPCHCWTFYKAIYSERSHSGEIIERRDHHWRILTLKASNPKKLKFIFTVYLYQRVKLISMNQAVEFQIVSNLKTSKKDSVTFAIHKNSFFSFFRKQTESYGITKSLLSEFKKIYLQIQPITHPNGSNLRCSCHRQMWFFANHARGWNGYVCKDVWQKYCVIYFVILSLSVDLWFFVCASFCHRKSKMEGKKWQKSRTRLSSIFLPFTRQSDF